MHAQGSLKECIVSAIDKGFTVYALTEHMPRSRQIDLYPEERHMKPSDTLEIFSLFHAQARLEQREAQSIHLLVGMEIEWIHPNTFNELSALLAQFHVDFLVGSVHHVDEVPIDFSKEVFAQLEERHEIQEIYSKYFDAQFEMLQKVKPLVVGHFDLIRIFVDQQFNAKVLEKVNRNIDFIVANNLLVEINSRGFKKCASAYPFRDVLSIMVSKGVKFTTSDDSHGPLDVGMYYQEMFRYCLTMGITKIYSPWKELNGKISVKEFPVFPIQ